MAGGSRLVMLRVAGTCFFTAVLLVFILQFLYLTALNGKLLIPHTSVNTGYSLQHTPTIDMPRWKTSTAAQIMLAAAASQASSSDVKLVRDLSGDGWTLSNPELNISVPAKLPSQAHLDLYATNVIGDPLYGLNDFNLRWVAWSNWTYTSDPIQGLTNDADATWLLFDGLDTFTSIEFCGQHVAATNNQFRQYWFDVSSILSTCTDEAPTLSINFGSAPLIANEIASQPGQRTWEYGIQIPFEMDNRWWVRKEGNDFGWDWGPAFAPAGLWKPAYVIQLGRNDIHVRNSVVDIYRQGQLNNLPPDQTQPWVLNASLDFLGSLPDGVDFIYRLVHSENEEIAGGVLGDVSIRNSTITGSVTIPSEKVKLWWPTGLGPQTLYDLDLKIVYSDEVDVVSLHKTVGFRTIVLNSGPITEEQLSQGIAPGDNWHFEINGHEFYAKGSNFIPPDVFWPRVDEKRIRLLFDAVKEGGQNMLRVWSTGAYSPDLMFDIADEYGILLWTEFEFGDAMYPVDHEFLENVREEAVYQVRRVNHHPSLAFWAGGNEMENLVLFNYVKKAAPEKFDEYIGEYEALFLNVLTPAVFENSRSISYQPSSTSNGYLKLDFDLPVPIVPRYENLTNGSIYGETDYYKYDSAVAFDPIKYPVGRFSNEFGYHSMPSIQSWKQGVSPKDLHFNSSTIQLRNHHYPARSLNTTNYYNASLGMGEMTVAVQRWYPAPNKTDPVGNFSSWCHATQIFQADYYKSQIQFYRRGSGLPERQLGCLYWQLEDQWQAPTWAGIEYDGRWKVLHYTAKDIYQNVIISPHRNTSTSDELDIHVTSDLWTSISATVNMTWYDWTGKPQNMPTPDPMSVTVGALNSTRVYRTTLNITLAGLDRDDLILVMDVSAEGQLPNSDTPQTFTHRNYFHPSPLSRAHLVDPGLSLQYSNDTKKFTVEATKGVAIWTWLDYPEGAIVNFDTNAFLLRPGEKKGIGYLVKSDSTGGEWVKGVTVRSLWDNTLP